MSLLLTVLALKSIPLGGGRWLHEWASGEGSLGHLGPAPCVHQEDQADKEQCPRGVRVAILKQARNKGGLEKASWRRGLLSARAEWQAPGVKTALCDRIALVAHSMGQTPEADCAGSWAGSFLSRKSGSGRPTAEVRGLAMPDLQLLPWLSGFRKCSHPQP